MHYEDIGKGIEAGLQEHGKLFTIFMKRTLKVVWPHLKEVCRNIDYLTWHSKRKKPKKRF